MTTTRTSAPPTGTVAAVMTRPARTATVDETIATAAARMRDHDVSSLVVLDAAGHVAGIVTERDVLHAAGSGRDLAVDAVSTAMTADPDCIAGDTATDVAWRRLAERGYRHFPVIDDGELLGVVALRDLTALAELRPADEALVAPPGLKGMIVAETALGDVRGDEGFYHYRQYSAPELATARSFEDVWRLLIDGSLPDRAERDAFADEVAPYRHLSDDVTAALPALSHGSVSHALRTALSHHAATLGLGDSLDVDATTRRTQALQLSAVVPTLIAALHRIRSGHDPIPSDDALPYAANYLHMLGIDATAEEAAALERYLVLGIDHGFNASTFTTRVVTSTGSDLGSAVVAGLGALYGPLHGGAPSRVLDTLDDIGTVERTEAWVRDRVGRGERIMGFGHPVYRTEDPRSVLLRSTGRALGGDRVDLAVQIEATVERVLAELKPDRVLKTNVEFYAAVVMERVGLPRALFTPTFAASRVVGWCAQALEQAADNRIIRPSSRYVGPTPPATVPTI